MLQAKSKNELVMQYPQWSTKELTIFPTRKLAPLNCDNPKTGENKTSELWQTFILLLEISRNVRKTDCSFAITHWKSAKYASYHNQPIKNWDTKTIKVSLCKQKNSKYRLNTAQAQFTIQKRHDASCKIQ